MIVLSVNAGSSSLKFQAFDMPEENVLISGTFERIGMKESFYTIKVNGEKINDVNMKFAKADFENEVIIKVTAEDGTEKEYKYYKNSKNNWKNKF